MSSFLDGMDLNPAPALNPFGSGAVSEGGGIVGRDDQSMRVAFGGANLQGRREQGGGFGRMIGRSLSASRHL